MAKLIHPGLLKNRNEFEAARHRYDIRVEAEKRTEARKLKESQEQTGQGIQPVDTQKG